jgi:uncharacterized RmlC-like cupin family protein
MCQSKADQQPGSAPPKQKFHVNFSKDAVFKDNLNTTAKDGQRAYIEYRDLGLSEATDGKFHAHIGRAKPGFAGDKHTRPHCHHLDFQMIYVLKGWTKMIYEGQEGVFTFRAGDMYFQPAGIVHDALESSDDFEALEILSPAVHETEEVDSVPGHEDD